MAENNSNQSSQAAPPTEDHTSPPTTNNQTNPPVKQSPSARPSGGNQIKSVKSESGRSGSKLGLIIGLPVFVIITLLLSVNYLLFRQAKGMVELAQTQQDNLAGVRETYRSMREITDELIQYYDSSSAPDYNIDEEENDSNLDLEEESVLGVSDEQSRFYERNNFYSGQGEKLASKISQDGGAFLDQANGFLPSLVGLDEYNDLVEETTDHAGLLTGVFHYAQQNRKIEERYIKATEDFSIAMVDSAYTGLDGEMTKTAAEIEQFSSDLDKAYGRYSLPASLDDIHEATKDTYDRFSEIINSMSGHIKDQDLLGLETDLYSLSLLIYGAEDVDSMWLSFWRSSDTVTKTEDLQTQWSDTGEEIKGKVPLYSLWDKIL